MLDLKKHTAEELMLIYQNNHPDEAYRAFEEIYFRYKNRVYSYLTSKVKNAEQDCEDLLQKIFIKFHEKKHLYSIQYKCEQWLFVIARTQLIDYFRATKKEIYRVESITNQFIWNEPIDNQIQDIDELKNLSINQREFLELKIIDELSYQEMSQILNKSETSLRKSFSRLIHKMKNGEVI